MVASSGEDEADPARGTLSYVSPVARALMGKQVDDTVPIGSSGAEILSIVRRQPRETDWAG
jgi:transcription elongation GreA/GreB family factor